jgi:hypothetical protein
MKLFRRWRSAYLAAAAMTLATLMGTAIQAAPMAYKDGVMFMSEFGPSSYELGANYAVTGRDAFGAMAAEQTTSAGMRRNTLHATYTRRAARWNFPAAQGNFWLFANLNQVRGDGLSGSVTAFEPGFQADYETTRVYFAANWHTQRAAGANDAKVRHNATALRAGFSFYEAEYEQVQPWLIVQAKRETGWVRERSVTPMLRLIHKAYFLELGVKRDLDDRRNTGQLNLMYTY